MDTVAKSQSKVVKSDEEWRKQLTPEQYYSGDDCHADAAACRLWQE